MNEYLMQYVNLIDPLATEDDVVELKELNEWDLIVEFADGRKVIYDRFTGYFKNIFYDNIGEITEEQEKKEFAYRLRSLMNRNRITQEQLSEKLNTTQAMISRYVRGETIPNVITLRKIANILDCSMDDFFYKEY